MDVVDKSVIKSGQGKGELIELSPLDVLTGHFSVRGVYVFKEPPNILRLKTMLAQSLTLYPEYSASMLREGNRFFLKLDDRGVGFSVYRSPQRWCDTPHLLPVTEDSPLIDNQLMPQDVFAGNEPLNAFRITLFDDGYWTLAVRNIHSQADGSAYCDFLQTWSALYCEKTPRAAVDFPRAFISSLAKGTGYKPSHKFRVFPALNFDLAERVYFQKQQQGYSQVSIAQTALKNLAQDCCTRVGTTLTTSDVMHALGWKAFALTSGKSNKEFCTLYTVFDLRHVQGLAIPRHYRGNAVIERHATMSFGELRTRDIDDIALFFRENTKPLNRAEIEADIAYLQREYDGGFVDDEYGRFSHFIRASVVDCLDGTGLFVNDMRFLKTPTIVFEGKPLWFETVIALGFNFMGIYRDNNDTLVIRYVGDKPTVLPFSTAITELLDGAELTDIVSAPLVTNPWR
ncbi:acyltransferase [Oceanicoccus sp. KOV_DT_Chl]|uniref:acyltransferase n=1 Tax=Oceanicoccus sp. KOV_DT_Chl TaxID=1904639 RepID=UPI000C7A0D19|nr:acyltransferase [Oceanicoccus sp. KOV_DT_Chl]